MKIKGGSSRGEHRSSALWGTGNRGGDSRSNALWGKGGRGLVTALVAVLVVAAPLAAGAHKSKNATGAALAATYVDPILLAKADTDAERARQRHHPVGSRRVHGQGGIRGRRAQREEVQGPRAPGSQVRVRRLGGRRAQGEEGALPRPDPGSDRDLRRPGEAQRLHLEAALDHGVRREAAVGRRFPRRVRRCRRSQSSTLASTRTGRTSTWVHASSTTS